MGWRFPLLAGDKASEVVCRYQEIRRSFVGLKADLNAVLPGEAFENRPGHLNKSLDDQNNLCLQYNPR